MRHDQMAEQIVALVSHGDRSSWLGEIGGSGSGAAATDRLCLTNEPSHAERRRVDESSSMSSALSDNEKAHCRRWNPMRVAVKALQ
jgi:hypothetical protein